MPVPTPRPALASVLSFLVQDPTEDRVRDLTYWTDTVDGDLALTAKGVVADGSLNLWEQLTPRGALARLASRAVWPWRPEESPLWWCEICGGTGYRPPTGPNDTDPYAGGGVWRCKACVGSGDRGVFHGLARAPSSLETVVAVTSLGRDTWLRARELVDKLTPGREMVVGAHPAAVLSSHHVSTGYLDQIDRGPHVLFSALEVAGVRWKGENCPLKGLAGPAETWWPALKELRLLGVHLVDCGPNETHVRVERLTER